MNDKEIDKSIANSPELTEYIIAALDFQQAVDAFERETAKTDFLHLEIVKDSDGRMVSHLPDTIKNIRLEEKAIIMDKKKDILIAKYPQLSSWDFDKICAHLDYISDNSVGVNKKFLEIGLDKNRPLTKQGYSEFFSSQGNMMGYIGNWITNPNYVEAYMVIYHDGGKEVYIDDKNDITHSYIKFGFNRNGTPIRNGRTIAYLVHTHKFDSLPSRADSSMGATYPNVSQAIYFNGDIKYFNIAH